jgi:hypothetical protein
MITACKILRIELAHLEYRTFEEFLQKHHNQLYANGGNIDEAPTLARAELAHHELRRKVKTR